MRKIALQLLHFYQRFLTVLGFGSCRYYPSCSEYAKQQFQHNNIFSAFYLSALRILKCNQLFVGGTDYPVVKCPHNCKNFKKIRVIYWFVPKDKHNCYIIKNFKSNQ